MMSSTNTKQLLGVAILGFVTAVDQYHELMGWDGEWKDIAGQALRAGFEMSRLQLTDDTAPDTRTAGG